MPDLQKTCPVCSKEFKVHSSRDKYGRGKTCSYECGRVFCGKSRIEKIEVPCIVCGSLTYRDKKKITAATKTYCSKTCQNRRLQVACLGCGAVVDKPLSANPKFCSKKCADSSEYSKAVRSEMTKKSWSDEGKRERYLQGIKNRSASQKWLSSAHFQKGEKHPRWKGGRRRNSRYDVKQWRNAVFTRDAYTCQECFQPGILNAHHIKSWADNPDLRLDVSNGITLCMTCHAVKHGLEPKHFYKKCEECGAKKPDSRSKLCRQCWTKKGCPKKAT